jgi:protein-S-isoprenylcysteine O-methyltransferase Ste14
MDGEFIFRMAFWLLMAILFVIRIRANAQVRRAGRAVMPDEKAIQQEGKGLFAARLASFFGMAVWMVCYALYPPWMVYLQFDLPAWLRWLGFLLGLGSLALLAWTHAALGEQYSPQLRLKEEHHLVTEGPYARIRHPMYTSFFVLGVSFALVTANWVFVLLALAVIWGLAARAPREEEMMLAEFGEEYREYMRRTGRYFPKPGVETPG